ncbi:MAG TPA: alpha/beta hydrolase [Thermoanaerobaculia bacterium]|jgi:pimeloyl-ACP methyl ester carboxylesterase|nr:alpha/beta hydrolase [Thermoanaerobaculia bacterium]
MVTENTITAREQAEIEAANASGHTPVVFVHGLWLHASSWSRWIDLFREAGYAALAPGWPDDPESVEESRQHPEVFAGKGVDEVTDHYAAIIRQLKKSPVIIGHSFGGLITQQLLGLGLGAAAVAIDPAPFRGVLPLPFSALKAAFPVLGNPANLKRAVSLTAEQFRFAFANAVSEQEAAELYATFAIPAPGRPLFQAATANIDPTTEAKVNVKNATRGPLLLISGEKDNTVPFAITHAEFKQYEKSAAVTEFQQIDGRGHSLTIDSGWREVADHALAFAKLHAA